jgi:hypothetical protein
MRRVTRRGGSGAWSSVSATGASRAKGVAKQSIASFQFLDLVRQETRHAVRGALRPTRPHVVDLAPKRSRERGGQFSGELLEEPREVRLQPFDGTIAGARE